MSTVEAFIYNRLAGTAEVAAIVGTRIYRIKMPDNPTLPAITYQTLSHAPTESFDGFSGLRSPVMAIDCWARSAGAVQDLAEKVRIAFHGYKGTASGITVQNILDWSHYDLYDVETDVYHVACRCRVWYS